MQSRSFRLVSYFAVASVVAFAIVALILTVFYRQAAIADLLALRESSNIALTQAFANSLWTEFVPFIASTSNVSANEMRANPELTRLYESVAAQMEGLSVVKVKVYDLEGRTVFSTDFNQIGEDKSSNPGFLAALNGGVVSQLTHRETFNAFDRVIEDRDVVESYVPIRPDGAQGTIEGVIEVYDDVTPFLQRVDETQRNIGLGVIATLAILYAVLYLVVKRADAIMRQQAQELAREREALEQEIMERKRVEETLRQENIERKLAEEALLRASQNLEQARDQALEALNLKARILANVSHDSRTPLTVITLRVEMLQRGLYGILTEQQNEMLDTILVSARQLLFFINNLLDQAQLEASKVTLDRVEFTPADFLTEIDISMLPLATRKGLKLTTEVDANLPQKLLGDPHRLNQIVSNLVVNAIKFTDQGMVKVRLCRPDDNHWALQVSDTGPGIAPEAQSRIFEAFWQVDGSVTREVASGVGLGLSIVKQLTALMDGQVAVQSESGSGSTFTVTLPIEPV
jgi:signal transduction histidine kinase